MHSPLSSAALQNSLTACMCHCKYTYEGLLFTQVCNDPAPMHCTLALANCIPQCPVLLCKTLSQHACVTVNAPIKVCCSYKCAVTQHQCTAALALAECIPHCPVLLCKTVSQQALCYCKYTYEGLLFIQVCSDPTAVNCSTGFGRMHSPLSSAALRSSLTACMCHCKCTYEGLLFIQVCSDPTPVNCSTGFGKMLSPLSSAALQNRLTACLCHCNHTCRGLLLIQVCSDPTPVLCSTGFGRMHSPMSSAALRNSLTACMCHCKYTYEGLLFTQVCNDPAPMHCTLALANCIPDCPVLLCKTLSQHACVTVNTPMKLCCSYKCAVTQHQ